MSIDEFDSRAMFWGDRFKNTFVKSDSLNKIESDSQSDEMWVSERTESHLRNLFF